MSNRKCKWCHEVGHNVRKCKALLDAIRSNDGNAILFPVSKNSRAQSLKTNLYGISAPSATESKPGNGLRHARTCSYCARSGHNVRSCGIKRANDRIKSQLPTIRTIREKIVAYCKQTCFGVGSLISINSPIYFYRSTIYSGNVISSGNVFVVTGINTTKVGVGFYPFEDIITAKSIINSNQVKLSFNNSIITEHFRTFLSF